jgi:hypothetical protein
MEAKGIEHPIAGGWSRGIASILVACLLLLAAVPGPAQAGSSGAWVDETSDPDTIYAATENAAGNVLAQYCYPKQGSCLYVVAIGITCDAKAEFPALINTEGFVAQVMLVCGFKMPNQNVLMFKSFDDADRIVRTASRMGIAVALKNQEFKVSRFDLTGSVRAIDRMRAVALSRSNGEHLDDGSTLPAEQHL